MSSNILDIIPRIKELYNSGGNIIQFLKNKNNRSSNSLQDILISYDFQSGSYVKEIENKAEYSKNYTSAIAKEINKLGDFNSILEVGVGEATTLANLIPKLNNSKSIKSYGFDLSWSRIHIGNQYIKNKKIKSNLFVSDLFNIPLKDSSIDIVYTSHSIEPNGGKEKEALLELFRITNKYLILLEPTYEFANDEGKARMDKNGYIKNLESIIKALNFNLIEYSLFKVSVNPLNPTGLYVIEKKQSKKEPFTFICPISGEILEEFFDHYFSKKSLISYPKINGIPCLCDFYGVLTSKHDTTI